MHLFTVLANGGGDLIFIIQARGMLKMNHKIAIIRGYPILEMDLAYGLPVSDGLPLALGQQGKTRFLPRIGDGYVKAKYPLGNRVAFVEEMAQHFLAHI